MVSIVQLAPGGSAEAPAGAILAKLSGAAALELVLLGADSEVLQPDFRKAPDEVIFVPRGPVVVTARSRIGQPFPPGTRVGVSLRSASGAGVEVVRPPAEVGGHQSAALVRVDTDGLIHDGLSEAAGGGGDGLFSRPWMRDGSYGYHVNHSQTSAQASWALVLDASASILTPHRRPGLGRLVEVLVGIVSTACGSEPAKMLVAAEPVRDASESLHQDEVDWAAALGSDPAPWPRITHAARSAEGVDVVVVVLDGVPVDYREFTAWAARTQAEVLVVAVGRSRYGLRLEDRPSRFWEEELAALDELAALERVRVVAITDLKAAAGEASTLADALFPVGRA